MCKVNGCEGSTAGSHSRYCKHHRQRDRRHGDPLQLTVRSVDLAPYRKKVRAILLRDPERTVENAMREGWDVLIDIAQTEIDRMMTGAPGNKWYRQVCKEFLKLRDADAFEEVLEVGLALYLMAEQEPRRFASFRGFKFQLVRRVRSTTDMNVGEVYDPASGKTKRWYRDMPPKAVMVMADMLVTFLARAAARIIHIDRHEREREVKRREALDKALDKISE